MPFNSTMLHFLCQNLDLVATTYVQLWDAFLNSVFTYQDCSVHTINLCQ